MPAGDYGGIIPLCRTADSKLLILRGGFTRERHPGCVLLQTTLILKISSKGRIVKEEIDASVFSKGPEIRALNDDQLMKCWDEMMSATSHLHSIYIDVHQRKLKNAPSALR